MNDVLDEGLDMKLGGFGRQFLRGVRTRQIQVCVCERRQGRISQHLIQHIVSAHVSAPADFNVNLYSPTCTPALSA